MMLKTRHLATHGVRAALSVRRIRAIIFAFATTLFVAGLTARVVAQNPGDELAVSDLYLNSPLPSPQIGPFTAPYNLNTLLGADRFYNAGYTGTNSVMANVEAGYIWNGHESLSTVGLIPTSGASGEFDRHATWVGMVMGGHLAGPNPGDYQRGMAYTAQLDSGAIATSWPTNNSSYPRFTTAFFLNTSSLSTWGPYRAAFITGVPAPSAPGGSRQADVVNSSWVFTNDSFSVAGRDTLSGTFDALINENPHTLLTLAAGNTLPSGAGPNLVPSPASCYNAMTVAGLTPSGGAYDLPSAFSNGGPNDYYDPVNGQVSAVRSVVDIAAPAENFAMAYYGGETGGNGISVYGPPSGPTGGPNYYSQSISGTSFAAPTVAGGAALLYDAAYARFASDANSRDARVIKAVLMNSADKTAGWNNGQTANPNGFGGVVTTQGLDARVGAGRMDLNKAFDQFLGGTTDVAGTLQGVQGLVSATGWDFGQVAEGLPNDYLINSALSAGTTFTATLTWFRDRRTNGATNYTDASFDNLDLELWSAVAGVATNLISTSDSRYNNTEHFTFGIPTTGDYLLRVRWTEEMFDTVGRANAEQYGLAWATAVPEPATILLLFAILPVYMGRRLRA